MSPYGMVSSGHDDSRDTRGVVVCLFWQMITGYRRPCLHWQTGVTILMISSVLSVDRRYNFNCIFDMQIWFKQPLAEREWHAYFDFKGAIPVFIQNPVSSLPWLVFYTFGGRYSNYLFWWRNSKWENYESAVEYRHNVIQNIMILHTSLRWVTSNINERLNPQKTPYTSP